MNGPPVVVFGATSTLGRALAQQWAQQGHPLVLVGRQAAEVARSAADVGLRHQVAVRGVVADAMAPDFPGVVSAALADVGRLAGLAWVFGVMPSVGDTSAAEVERVFRVNLTAAVAAVEDLLPRVDRDGCVLLVSSVAGDRGRRSNYLYGAAKAGLTVYGQGLRHRLARGGPRVTVVKLGVVDSQMTWGRSAPGATTPARAARAIAGQVARGRGVVYVPSWWRWVVTVLRLLPEPLFNRLDF